MDGLHRALQALRRATAGASVSGQDRSAAQGQDGWTPLQLYAYIVRNLGLPARFHFDGEEWVGEAPFTQSVPQSILDLLESQGV